MSDLPVRKLPGVGKVNEQILSGLGVIKCSDGIALATAVYVNFTENAFDFIMRACLGIARNIHEDQGLKKSLNISETFTAITDYEQIKSKIEKLCQELESRAKQ